MTKIYENGSAGVSFEHLQAVSPALKLRGRPSMGKDFLKGLQVSAIF
ncbi:MAG: hypothetical protein H0U18_05995 [Pyrinomonadaceae bacterium]|nr:hypothetical protein [Pyrinomonadaceae bacterium]